MIGFALFTLFFAAMFALWIPTGEAPWFGWFMAIALSLAGVSLLAWAGICTSRHVYWWFEATEEKIVWFRSDRFGEAHEKNEVAVREVAGIWSSRGGPDGGGGLYLQMRSGDTLNIGGIAEPEARFLEWVSENYPHITLKIDE